MSNEYLYHYTTLETLQVIQSTQKIRASALSNFLKKNGADVSELKHGLTILSELICNFVIENYVISNELDFREKLSLSLDFDTVYQLSICGDEGK